MDGGVGTDCGSGECARQRRAKQGGGNGTTVIEQQ